MDLKEYLKRIYTLETSLYEQRIILQKTNQLLRQVSNPEYVSVPQLPSVPQSAGGKFISAVISAIIGLLIGGVAGAVLYGALFLLIGLLEIAYDLIGFIAILFSILPPSEEVAFFQFFDNLLLPAASSLMDRIVLFAIIGAAICSVIGFFITLLGSMSQKEDYSQEMVAYQHALKKNEQIKNMTTLKISSLQQQLNQAKKIQAQTENTLNQLYALDIIFPKYRNIIPVTMFYEYICSGRCSSLEGHEGGYNIYEQELRMNLILSKLDDIIERLDQIQENQFMLFNTIQSSNKKADQIYESIRQCSDSLQSIQESSEIAAYFGQISAINTTYSTWIKK